MRIWVFGMVLSVLVVPAAFGQKRTGCPVVEIRVGAGPENGSFDQGTGFVAGKNTIATVKHVIEHALANDKIKIYVRAQDAWRKATLLYAPSVTTDKYGRETQEGDLAILEAETEDIPSLPLAGTIPGVGEPLTSYQYGCERKLTLPLKSIARETHWLYTGCPSCMGPQWRIYTADFLTLTGVVPNGASGSPALDKNGKLVGIVFSGNDCSFCNYSRILDIAELRQKLKEYAQKR